MVGYGGPDAQAGHAERRRPGGGRVALGGGPGLDGRPGRLAGRRADGPTHPRSRQNVELLSKPRCTCCYAASGLAHLRTAGGLGRRPAPRAVGAISRCRGRSGGLQRADRQHDRRPGPWGRTSSTATWKSSCAAAWTVTRWGEWATRRFVLNGRVCASGTGTTRQGKDCA